MKRELGKFELANALSGEYAPFNAVSVLSLTNGPNPETLQKAFHVLQQRHFLLRVQILKSKNHYNYESEGTPQIPLRIVYREKDNHWISLAEQELNRGFDLVPGPLVRCTYLVSSGQDSDCEILLTFHHSIVDAASAIHFLHNLLSLSADFEMGNSIDDLSPLPLLLPEENYFPPTFKGLSRRWKTFQFAFRQIGDEIKYRHQSRGQKKAAVQEKARCRILTVEMPAETTEKIIRNSRSKKVTLNSILSAAMLMAVARNLYGDQDIPLRHISFPDLRPYLKPPISEENMGVFHSMIRSTIFMRSGQDFWELAHQINKKIYKASKRGDKFIAPLMSPQMMSMFIRSQKMRMATTALSYPGIAKIGLSYGNIQVKKIHGFVSNFPIGPEYTATARIFNRKLWWDILYLDTDMDQNKAAKIADEIRSILQSAGQS
jgi:NRPS condensation-like uncharacterized protein